MKENLFIVVFSLMTICFFSCTKNEVPTIEENIKGEWYCNDTMMFVGAWVFEVANCNLTISDEQYEMEIKRYSEIDGIVKVDTVLNLQGTYTYDYPEVLFKSGENSFEAEVVNNFYHKGIFISRDRDIFEYVEKYGNEKHYSQKMHFKKRIN